MCYKKWSPISHNRDGAGSQDAHCFPAVDSMYQTELFHQLSVCIDLLESAASVFARNIPRPRYVQYPRDHFEYDKPDVRIYAVLRCVRIVSDFRAVEVLLNLGHVQQVGVLLRTILEFTHDLDFVVEGSFVNPESRKRVNEMVSRFFAERFRDTKELLEEANKEPTTPRKKIYAAIGRLLGFGNPHRPRQIAKALEDVYSGYVHGNYYHIMELYNESTQKYEMSGQRVRFHEWLQYVALCIHPVFNVFSIVASALGLTQLEQELINKRKDLEVSPLYQRKSIRR